jgi:hypothetical protein
MSTTIPGKGGDHIEMNFNVKGKQHVFKIHRQRFEKTGDGIDKMVLSGRHDVDSIHRKWGHRMAGPPEAYKAPKASPAKTVRGIAKAANTAFSKEAHVRKYVSEMPGAESGTLAKSAAATSGGQLTYANAYYLVKKLRKGAS